MILNLSYYLLLIMEGCIGPTASGQVCNGQNFSVRVPYESLEQCETASKRVMVPGGFQKYVRGVCMAVPNTPPTPPAPAAAPAPAPAK